MCENRASVRLRKEHIGGLVLQYLRGIDVDTLLIVILITAGIVGYGLTVSDGYVSVTLTV